MNTESVDDKVLLKRDGMPTYHLAVIVDDHTMKITHIFRGEEWLPSAPVHVLLYKYFGWENEMPQFAHLPLILKPDGNGKLSKRDGERLGFPVFALEWDDPNLGRMDGFREIGFLPQAFINMLALLGWNDGSAQEIFTLEELCERFDMNRVHAHGAKFDFEKAKWFNKEWIKRLPAKELMKWIVPILKEKGLDVSDDKKVEEVVELTKERCTLLSDFVEQSDFFFRTPNPDLNLLNGKNWDDKRKEFFHELISVWDKLDDWSKEKLEETLVALAENKQLKPGKVLFPLRIMLVGGKFGPHIYDIAEMIGKEETMKRIKNVLEK